MNRRLLLTTREAAEALGVAPATIRDWQRRGLVTRGAGGRWDLLELRAAQHAPKPRRQPGNPPPANHDEP